MVQVITEEDFKPVLERLDRLEAENTFLRQLLMDIQWLNVKQVAKALNCSATTVYRLVKEKRLEHRHEGSRPFFSVDVVRAYLLNKKISTDEVSRRLVRAAHT